MRHTVFFTFLFTNMVSAAAVQEDAPIFLVGIHTIQILT